MRAGQPPSSDPHHVVSGRFGAVRLFLRLVPVRSMFSARRCFDPAVDLRDVLQKLQLSANAAQRILLGLVWLTVWLSEFYRGV